MNFIFLGPPGSGKGTQSFFLKNKYNLTHLSIGDLFRTEINKQSKIGKISQKYVNKGEYVPNNITNQIIKKYLYNIKKNFILDGYPRNFSQAKWLNNLLKNLNQKILIVLYLDISIDIVIQRLSSRLICPQCKSIYNIKFLSQKINNICDIDKTELIKRIDDNNKLIIINRFKNYQLTAKLLINYYQNLKILKIINANQNNLIIKKQIQKYILFLMKEQKND